MTIKKDGLPKQNVDFPNHAQGVKLLQEATKQTDLQAIYLDSQARTTFCYNTDVNVETLAKMIRQAKPYAAMIVGVRASAWIDGLENTISQMCELEQVLLLQVVRIHASGMMETIF